MALSSPTVERLIRKSGAERVSREASRELAKFLEERAVKVSEKAMKYAEEENRKTIRRQDIRKAVKELKK